MRNNIILLVNFPLHKLSLRKQLELWEIPVDN